MGHFIKLLCLLFFYFYLLLVRNTSQKQEVIINREDMFYKKIQKKNQNCSVYAAFSSKKLGVGMKGHSHGTSDPPPLLSGFPDDSSWSMFSYISLQPIVVLTTLLSATVTSCYICSKCKICLSFSGIGNMRLKFLRRNELRGGRKGHNSVNGVMWE